IKTACRLILQNIFQKNPPPEADIGMRQALNGIKFGLEKIKQKKGQQNRETFDKDLDLTTRAHMSFNLAFDLNLKELDDKKNAKASLGTDIQSHPLSQPDDKDPRPNGFDILIGSKEYLEGLIEKFDTVPNRDYSWSGFFKSTWNRAWKRHPFASGISSGTLLAMASYS